jgi:hypothetical protein
MAKEGRRVMTISDCRAVTKVDVAVRSAFGKHSNSQSEAVRKNNLVSIVVVESGVLRAALTAITWLSPQMRSTRAVKNLDDAAEAVRAACATGAVPVPPTLELLLRNER